MANKRAGILLVCLKLTQMLQAQNTQTWTGAYYSGQDLQTTNPAMISSGPYRNNLQVFSFAAFAGGNNASLSFSKFTSNEGTWLKSRLVSTQASSTAAASLELQGPSGYKEFAKFGTVGFSIGARFFAHANNIDGRLLSELDDHGVATTSHPYTVPLSNRMSVSATAFAQLGLSWAKQIYKSERHVLHLGIAAKLLDGASHTDLQFDNLQGTVKYNTNIHDGYLTSASGNIAVRTSGVFFESPNFSTLLKGAVRVGFGFGMIYEWKDKGILLQQHSRETIPYRLRIGLAVKDIGTLRFAPDTAYTRAYSMLIPSTKSLYLHSTFSLAHFYNVAKTLDAYPSLFIKEGTTKENYTVFLPTSIDVSIEYRFQRGYYVAGYSSVGITRQNISSAINALHITALSVGYENKAFGFAIPFSYCPLTKFCAGAGLRYKWITIGSSSLFTSLSGKGKQLDGCIGVSLNKFKN